MFYITAKFPKKVTNSFRDLYFYRHTYLRTNEGDSKGPSTDGGDQKYPILVKKAIFEFPKKAKLANSNERIAKKSEKPPFSTILGQRGQFWTVFGQNGQTCEH